MEQQGIVRTGTKPFKAKGKKGRQWNGPSVKVSLQEVIDLLEDDPFTDMSWIDFSLPPVNK